MCDRRPKTYSKGQLILISDSCLACVAQAIKRKSYLLDLEETTLRRKDLNESDSVYPTLAKVPCCLPIKLRVQTKPIGKKIATLRETLSRC